MPIEYSEVQSSGISESDFNALSSKLTNIDKEVLVYRQYPSFTNNIGTISRTSTDLFSAAGDGAGIVRAFISGGHLYAEYYTTGSGWSGTSDLGAIISVRPKVFIDGSGYNILGIVSDGSPTVWNSSDGTTWDGGTAFSTINLPIDGTLEWIGYGGGNLPIVYAVINQSSGARKIEAVDSTTEYDLGVYWPSKLLGFDCEYIIQPQDNGISDSNTDLRHILTLSVHTPSIYVYRTVSGVPVKTVQLTGGLISFIVRPPNSGRLPQISYYYPIDLSDDFSIQNRVTCHLTPSSSIFDTSNHDTLFAIAYGQNGDVNAADASYAYPVIAYYSSRDGKHWSQDSLVECSDVGGTLPDFSNGVQIVSYSANVYLLTSNGLIASPGCLEWNNPDDNETVDLTDFIAEYSSSFNDARQTNLLVVNRDGALNDTILLSGISCTLVTKFGSVNHKFQVSIEDIDSIQPSRELPRETLNISARDRTAWITDKSQSEAAVMWDNQIIGRDNYIDIGGVQNSGLSHTATVKGTFTTDSNQLRAISNFVECIFFNTYKAAVRDGSVSAVFSLPNPTGPNPDATSTDSPTYAGVVFRAIDKDNLWACRYNYWTDKIELIERRAGADTVRLSITPQSAYSTRGQSGGLFIAIKVEFKGARIRIYESTNYYSGVGGIFNGVDYRYDDTYIIPEDTTSTPAWLEGYVGGISSGYSDVDVASDTPPDPTSIVFTGSIWGTEDSYEPASGYTVGYSGQVYKGTGWPSSPAFTSLGVSSLIRSACMPPGADWSGFDSPRKIMTDPFNYKSLIVLGTQGIYWTDDATVGSPTWNYVTPTLPPPYDGVFSPVFTDIAGSVNRQNFFIWTLAFPFHDASNPLYIQWTDDKFATIHTVLVSATGAYYFNGAAWYMRMICIQQWCFNHGTTGVFYIQTGTGASLGGLARTNDWGQTWTIIDPQTGSQGGGAMSLGFSKIGGGNNDGDEASRLDALVQFMGDDGTGGSVTHQYNQYGVDIAAHGRTTIDVQAIEYGRQLGPCAINTFTLDSKHANFAGFNGILITQDGGATYQAKPAPLAGTSVQWNGINGWPTNPNWLIYWVGQTLAISSDRGDTWTDIGASVGPERMACAIADFSLIYPVGGVHP